MAEGKKGFILYADQKEIFKQLSDQKAGILIKHIFKYVNDESPTSNDIIINLAFTPIKQQLKRDLNTYENICERNRLNGQKGGRPKNPKNPKEPKEPSGLLGNPKEPKEPDTDNDIDNDNDIVNAFIKNVYSVSDELLMSKSIVGDFLNHWTEKDYENKCFAWQVPETFIIKSRLKGWKKNNDKSKPIKEKNPFLL